MRDAGTWIGEEAAREIRAAIAEADGAEVFFAGRLDSRGLLSEVVVLARGNDEAVPALLEEALRFDAVLHNHPSGELKPSEADLAIASRLASAGGVGFLIVDQEVRQAYPVVEPVVRRSPGRLDPDELAGLLAAGGRVAEALRGWEERPEQVAMVRQVARSFNRGEILLVEAGTGTGKSLAYLIPAVLWTQETGERCVISTGTINLQQQLIGKDLPFVARVLDSPVRFVLVKGRSNYLCLQKLAALQAEMAPLLRDRENEELRMVIDWAARTKDGSVSDLSFQPSRELWDKLAADGDTCLHLRCPRIGRCFFTRARRDAASADILVVNHHLLFADLAIKQATGEGVGGGVLPPFTRLILDEGHAAEDAASSFFGQRFSRNGAVWLIRRLRRTEREGGGLVGLIKSRAERLPRGGEAIAAAADRALTELEGLPEAVDQAFEEFLPFLTERGQRADGDLKLRIRPELEQERDWEPRIRSPLLELATRLEESLRRLGELERPLLELEGDELLLETVQLRAMRGRLSERVGSLRSLLAPEAGGDTVRWLEGRPGRRRIMALQGAPLRVGPLLREALFESFPTVVVTSATLTADGSFRYVRDRLGVPESWEQPVEELVLPSSFDFRRQALIAVPTDLPSPGESAFAEELPDCIRRALLVTGGRAFVLFTSYGLMDRMHRALLEPLNQAGLAVLKQGQEDRHRLLERFKEDETSVLFGTDSFWQGVDAPGRTLELVILTRLPFRVPTDPLIEARVEAVERDGGRAFTSYTVPQAIIRFKQGFGRLIRSRSDRGVVMVLDKRLVERSYGRAFLRSLPECERVVGSSERVLESMGWFYTGQSDG